MRIASPYSAVAGTFIAGLFVVRAASGVPAGVAYDRGRNLEADERFAEAAPLLDRAAVGDNRVGALWRSGRSLLSGWRRMHTVERYGAAGDKRLRAAAVRFLTARAASPGSAWFTAAMGEVYTLRERAANRNRDFDFDTLARGPWAMVGDDGRVAIGLLRAAIESEPNRFIHRDQLVAVFVELGLREDALRAIDDAARVLPAWDGHNNFSFELLPRELIERFWQTSRTVAPGDVPMMLRERQLLASGQLGRRLGHFVEAEADLRAALQTPATQLNGAEDAFHLALLLVDLGRFDEAETMLARAERTPVFRPGVAETRARIAEKQERWTEALGRLNEVRRLRPRELWVLLDFARVAQKTGNWDQAEESLRWATLVHPQDPVPRQSLVEMYLAKGDKGLAQRALDDYVRSFGRTEDAARMEQLVSPPLDPNRR